MENSTKLGYLQTLRWLLSYFLAFFIFLQIYQAFYEKIIKTWEIWCYLTRSNNLQVNRTNHDFLAQLYQNNGKHFSNLSALCLDPMFMSICSGSSCSHNPTSPNKSGSLSYMIRKPWGPCGPHQHPPTTRNTNTNHFSSLVSNSFQIAGAKSLL